MEGALITAAAGALKPVLGKLAALLGDEYTRFRRVRKEIEFLSRELAAMEAFLLKKSMEEDPDVQDKLWMKEVRELSYDIEDSLDDFMENSGDKSAKPGGFMKKIKNLLDKTKDRRQIAKAIEELKKQVIEAAERQKRYNISEAASKVNNVTVDPRALAIFEDVSNLVGIDGPKEELIRLFAQETRSESRQQQNPKMISIVGFGGLGKTTLASQVYKDLKGQFDCHAFVSVSRNPDMIKVLGNIHTQLTGRDHSSTGDIPRLITTISNFLEDKRYFIVVDDIWNVEIWEAIQFAFPVNVYDCRIITTTRVNDVAQSCCSTFNGHVYTMNPLGGVHSRQLFHKRLFSSGECPPHLEEVSSQILKKCAGLPLAIIATSSLLANKEKTKDKWHQVESSMGCGLERNASVEAIVKIISLSYFDLPHHLKTCLLYLSIFPEDFVVEKEILIRRWIAEGFIQKKNGYTLYEAGEMCFNELLNRSLIQPDFKNQLFDEVTGCRVHDTVLDFIVSKSIEENFVTIIGVPGINPDSENKVRRLSLQNAGMKLPAGLNLSSVRSLHIFGFMIPSLLEFKHLRVLCIDNCLLLGHDNLASVGNLLYLKCLRLNSVFEKKIPDEIAKLRYLQTLDIVYQLPKEVSVPPNISVDGRLVHFVLGGFNIPNEFEGMDSLEVLGRIVVEHQSSEFFQRLGLLTNLRKLVLEVRSYDTQREMACSIRKLANANLRSLSISLPGRPNTLEFVEELNLPSQCRLRELDLGGFPIKKVPRWMGSLVNLHKLRLGLWDGACPEDVKMVGGLPNLRYIRVYWYPAVISVGEGKAEMERVIEAHPNHPMLVSYDVLDLMEKMSSSKSYQPQLMGYQLKSNPNPLDRTRGPSSSAATAGAKPWLPPLLPPRENLKELRTWLQLLEYQLKFYPNPPDSTRGPSSSAAAAGAKPWLPPLLPPPPLDDWDLEDVQPPMEDWDAQDFHPVSPIVGVKPIKSNWDDEDVEEDDIKESYEEEEEEEAEKPKPPPVEKPAPKPSATKKGKQPSMSTEVVEDEVPDDPAKEKLRQQRL